MNQSAQSIATQLNSSIKDQDELAYAALLILFIAFILMSVGLILANLAFIFVIITQERKFKYIGNLSWCTSSCSLGMIFTACLYFSFKGP
jgi:hypothetical protein